MSIEINKGSFDNLSPMAKLGVLVAAIVVAAGLFFYLVLKPKMDRLDTLNAENAKLQREVQEGTAVEIRYNEFQQELSDMEARLVVLQTILPTEKEASNFLRSIQKMAADSSLKINLFKPRALVPHDFYSDWPVEIKLEGNYHGLGRFFEKISRTPRIIDVPTLSIEHIEDQTNTSRTIIATGIATTYVQGVDQVQTETKEGER
ncbi:MAG: type 4a pilus biogenesis protein PilO [Acidobacteriota bacterium]|jgi:type IV pilus assembly protein PilO|nr:type 4a pilus biogenesis protein PilO [Acidobacteriota bacterium]